MDEPTARTTWSSVETSTDPPTKWNLSLSNSIRSASQNAPFTSFLHWVYWPWDLYIDLDWIQSTLLASTFYTILEICTNRKAIAIADSNFHDNKTIIDQVGCKTIHRWIYGIECIPLIKYALLWITSFKKLLVVSDDWWWWRGWPCKSMGLTPPNIGCPVTLNRVGDCVTWFLSFIL